MISGICRQRHILLDCRQCWGFLPKTCSLVAVLLETADTVGIGTGLSKAPSNQTLLLLRCADSELPELRAPSNRAQASMFITDGKLASACVFHGLFQLAVTLTNSFVAFCSTGSYGSLKPKSSKPSFAAMHRCEVNPNIITLNAASCLLGIYVARSVTR